MVKFHLLTQTHILSFGIELDFQSRHIKQSHRKVFMAFDFSHFISFLFSICVRAVRVCRSINRMNLSPRKGVRVSLLRVHVLMLLLYSQIERLRCVCIRSCVRIYSKSTSIFIFSVKLSWNPIAIYVCTPMPWHCVYSIARHRNCRSSKCCVWFWSAKQKSHPLWFRSATATAMTMAMRWDFPWGIRLTRRFIWFLVVLPPSVLCGNGVIPKSIRVRGLLSVFVRVCVEFVLRLAVWALYQSTIHLYWFFVCVSCCQFDMQKNEIGWIHKCTPVHTLLEHIYWFALLLRTQQDALSTFFVCFPLLFTFSILILCWFSFCRVEMIRVFLSKS